MYNVRTHTHACTHAHTHTHTVTSSPLVDCPPPPPPTHTHTHTHVNHTHTHYHQPSSGRLPQSRGRPSSAVKEAMAAAASQEQRKVSCLYTMLLAHFGHISGTGVCTYHLSCRLNYHTCMQGGHHRFKFDSYYVRPPNFHSTLLIFSPF